MFGLPIKVAYDFEHDIYDHYISVYLHESELPLLTSCYHSPDAISLMLIFCTCVRLASLNCLSEIKVQNAISAITSSFYGFKKFNLNT